MRVQTSSTFNSLPQKQKPNLSIETSTKLPAVFNRKHNLVVYFEEILLEAGWKTLAQEKNLDVQSFLRFPRRPGFSSFFEVLSANYNIILFTNIKADFAIKFLTELGLLKYVQTIFSNGVRKSEETEKSEASFWKNLEKCLEQTVFITSWDENAKFPVRTQNLINMDVYNGSQFDQGLDELSEFLNLDCHRIMTFDELAIQDRFYNFASRSYRSQVTVSTAYFEFVEPDCTAKNSSSVCEFKVKAGLLQFQTTSTKTPSLDSSASSEEISEESECLTPTNTFSPSLEKLRPKKSL